MKKKIVTLFLCGTMALTVLTACSLQDYAVNTAKKAVQGTESSDGKVNYSKTESSDLEVMSYDGDSQASLTLGLRYDYGIQGENQNYQEALNWYERSADQGNSNAMVHLGYMYLYGLGTDKDLNRSLSYFQESAAAGNSDGYAGLGRYYIINNTLENAASNAYTNIKTAADKKNPMGIYLLGYLYEKGIGVAADQDTAAEYYEKLTSKDLEDVSTVRLYPYQEAYVRRALLYLQNVLAEASEDSDSADSQNSTDTSSDSDAKTQNTTNSKEAKKALNLLKKVSDTNYAPAEYYLGIIYEKGIGTGKSYTNARTYFEKAGKQDYAPAQNRLGYIYFNGLGVDVDYGRSAYYQKLAAAQGFAPAQVNLGYLYENGLGVDKNLAVARQYYQMAADQNYQGAAEAVSRVDQKIQTQ